MVFGFTTSAGSDILVRPQQHQEGNTMLRADPTTFSAKKASIDSSPRRMSSSPNLRTRGTKPLVLQRRNNSGSTVDIADDDSRYSSSSQTMPPPLALITTSSSSYSKDSSTSERVKDSSTRINPNNRNSNTFLSRIRKRNALFGKHRRSMSLLANDGKPPLMKTRVRVGEDGGVETFYYNGNELDYSDDEQETSGKGSYNRDQAGSFSRCVSVGGYCSSDGGTGLSSSLDVHRDVASYDDGFEEDDDDDSLCGSMYFVNNESTLLEFSPEELVSPHKAPHHQQQSSKEKRRLSLSSFRPSRTMH
jgi:hypothetical protein